MPLKVAVHPFHHCLGSKGSSMELEIEFILPNRQAILIFLQLVEYLSSRCPLHMASFCISAIYSHFDPLRTMATITLPEETSDKWDFLVRNSFMIFGLIGF